MGTDRPIKIAPSVLTADFAHLGDLCKDLERSGADLIHWDVMDGHFVPRITLGPDVIASCRKLVKLPFEVHMMVDDPDHLVQDFVDAGCERIIVHAEACKHLHRSLQHIGSTGATAAVALNPATPAAEVENVLDLVEQVLAMTVNPGWGGQRYIETMNRKVSTLRQMVVETGRPLDLEVDGGVHFGTASGAAAAGANILVSGTGILDDDQGLEHAITELRKLATEAARG